MGLPESQPERSTAQPSLPEMEPEDITPQYLQKVRRFVRDVLAKNILEEIRRMLDIQEDRAFPEAVRDIVRAELLRGSAVHGISSFVPYYYPIDGYDGTRSSTNNGNE